MLYLENSSHIIIKFDDFSLTNNEKLNDETFREGLVTDPKKYIHIAYETIGNNICEYLQLVDKNSICKPSEIRLILNNDNLVKQINSSTLINFKIDYEWRKYGPSNYLIDLLSELIDNPEIDLQPDSLMIYLSCLLEKNADVSRVMKKIYPKKDSMPINNYLLVSNYCNRNGITNKLIRKSSELYDHLKKSESVVNSLISNYKLIIVGNAHNNKENIVINQKDELVIRFNNYPSIYYADIWVRNMDLGAISDYLKKDIRTYKAVLFDTDINRSKIPNCVINDLYRCVIYDIPLYIIPVWDEILLKYDIFPTSGFELIYYCVKNNINFKIQNFSSFEEMPYYTHDDKNYVKQCVKSSHHNKKIESDFYHEHNLL